VRMSSIRCSASAHRSFSALFFALLAVALMFVLSGSARRPGRTSTSAERDSGAVFVLVEGRPSRAESGRAPYAGQANNPTFVKAKKSPVPAGPRSALPGRLRPCRAYRRQLRVDGVRHRAGQPERRANRHRDRRTAHRPDFEPAARPASGARRSATGPTPYGTGAVVSTCPKAVALALSVTRRAARRCRSRHRC
jgi:hypothetical protein